MRTVSGGEATLLTQAHVNHYVRVYVTGAPHGGTPGVEQLLTELSGWDWVDSVSWDGETVDRQIATATIQLRRDRQDGTSLAPLIAVSGLNVDAGGSTYAPLLDVGRAIRITTAVTDHGTAPGSGDWKEVFKGRIDSIDWENDPITVQCSDLGAWLMDAAIQTATSYGSNSGATVESVMQAILNDWPPFTGTPVTLYELNSSGVAVAVGSDGALSPSWTIPKAYTQQPMPVLEALNNLVAQFGWTLRYHYDTAGTFAFTLYQPPRSTTTSLATIGTSTYREVRKCAIAIADVRNTFALTYYNTSNAAVTATDSDSASVAAYGTRFMRLAGDSVTNIRNSTDAATMLAAMKADLSAPKLDHEVELLYYWPAQAYDLYTFPANGVHYDSDQKLAVTSVRHEAKGGEISTTLAVRGNVIGAYAEWLTRRITTPVSGDGSSLIGVDWPSIAGTPTTLAGYGITDAYTKTAADARYLALAGGTVAGNVAITGTLAVTGVTTLTAQPILSSLTASRAVFTDGSKGLVSNAITGTGNVVMSASPTFTGTVALVTLSASGIGTFGDTASGRINLVTTAASQGVVRYDATGNTVLFLENTYDLAAASIQLRLRTAGTPVTALTATDTLVTVAIALVVGTDPTGAQILRVGGAGYINGALKIAGALTGATTGAFSSAVTLSSTLAVSSTATLSGDVYAKVGLSIGSGTATAAAQDRLYINRAGTGASYIQWLTNGSNDFYVGTGNGTSPSTADLTFNSGSNPGGGTGNVVGWIVKSTGLFQWNYDMAVAGKSGFNNTAPISKPTVTGSRGSNAALASLLTALANYGLITDSSS